MNELTESLENDEDFVTIEKIACLAILLNNKKFIIHIFQSFHQKINKNLTSFL